MTEQLLQNHRLTVNSIVFVALISSATLWGAAHDVSDISPK